MASPSLPNFEDLIDTEAPLAMPSLEDLVDTEPPMELPDISALEDTEAPNISEGPEFLGPEKEMMGPPMLPPAGPTDTDFGDLARRVPAGIAESSFDAAGGVLKVAGDAATIPQRLSIDAGRMAQTSALNEAITGMGTPEGTAAYQEYLRRRKAANEKAGALAAQPNVLAGPIQSMRELSERSKSDYGVDPSRDQQFWSQAASGVGTIVPAMASGPLAPVTIAGMMGEGGRKDAEAHGATQEQQNQAFYANAAVGALSEFAMGVPALLRSAKAAKMPLDTFRRMVKSVALQVVKSSAREGVQEGMEQAAQNAIASEIAQYEKDRSLMEGVPQAMAVGAVIGAPVGGVTQVAANADQKVWARSVLDGTDEQVVELAMAATDRDSSPEVTEAAEKALDQMQKDARTILGMESEMDETDKKILELKDRGMNRWAIAEELGLPEEEVRKRGERLISQRYEQKGQNQPVENTGEPDLSKFGSAVRPQPEPELQVDPETGVALTPTGPVRVTEEGDIPLAPVEQASLRSLGRDVSPSTPTVEELEQRQQAQRDWLNQTYPENATPQPQQEPQTPIQPAPAPQQPGQPTDTQGDVTAAAQTAVLEDGSAVQPVGPQPSMAPEVEVATEPAIPVQQQPSAPAEATVTREERAAAYAAERDAAPKSDGLHRDVTETLDQAQREYVKLSGGRMSQTELQRLDASLREGLTATESASEVHRFFLRHEKAMEAARLAESGPDAQAAYDAAYEAALAEDKENAAQQQPAAAASAPAPVSTPSGPAAEPATPVQEPPTPPTGAAQPTGAPENVTGLRRALVDEDVVRAGMATLPDFKKETFQGYIDAANARLGKEAKAAEKLVDSLVGNPRPLVTAEESGLLLHEYATRKKELENARNAALNSTPETRDYANARFKEAQQKFQEAYEVARYVGHERGVSLASQKLLVDDQFELTTMEADVRVRDNNGEALSEKQMREISEYHAEIQRLREEIQRYQDQQAQMAAEATVENIAEEEGAADKPASKKESKLIKRLEEKAAEARKNLRAKVFKVGSSPDLSAIGDLATIGAYYIARGVRSLASFTARLVSEFGEGVRGIAPQVYEAAKAEYQNTQREVSTPSADEVIEEVDPKDGLSREVVAGVVRAHLRNGVTGSGPVLNATLETLKTKFPDLTISDVHQELSQYGKVKYPSRDSIEKELARLTTISRLQRQLEDVMNKQPPKKTGLQRPESDAEIRELQKQISDLMRANNIQTDDPNRLATGLRAVKRRMLNEIEEIEKAIKGNKRRTANQRTVQYDEEARQLQQRLAEARGRYNEAFPQEPISEQEQISRAVKAVERSIAEEERMLREGTLQRPPRAEGPTSPELENRRMELDALRQLRRELWQAENPGKTPEQRALDAALAAAKKSIARMDEMFRTGNLTPQQRQQKFNSTDELDALRSERDAMATAIRELRMAERPKTSQEERTIKALEKSIAAIDQRLQSGDLSPAARHVNRPETQRITELREIRDDLNKKLQEARKDARPPTSDEVKEQRRVKRELKALDKQIEELNRRVAANDLSPRNRVQNRPEVKELAERRELRDSLRESLDELRKAQKPAKDPDKARLDANKKAVQKRTKDLQEKLRNKDYSKPTRKQVDADNELKKLRYDYDKLKEQWHKERFLAEMKHWTWNRRVWDIALNIAGLQRVIKLGIDFGVVLRQGIHHVFARPGVVFGRAIPSMMKAFASERNQHAIMAELQKLEGYKSGLWKRTKLAVIDPGEYRLNKMEEEFASRWAAKIPGLNNFERATITFLNVVRAYAFETLVATSDTTGKVDENRAQVIANLVNATSGRGNLGRFETWAAPAAAFALSPRFYVSRLQVMTGHSFLWGTGGKGDWVTRKIIGSEYGRMALGRAVYYMLWVLAAAMAGEKLEEVTEWNPLSSDAGKIRWGSNRIDGMGGTAAFVTFALRMLLGRTKSTTTGDIKKLYGEEVGYNGDDTNEVIRRFWEGRRSHTFALIHDLARREHYGGKEMTPFTLLEETFMPLTVADAYSTFRNHSAAKSAILSGAMFWGESNTDHQSGHSIIYDTLNAMDAGLEEPKTDMERMRERRNAPQTAAEIRRQLRKELGVPSAKQLRKEIMGE